MSCRVISDTCVHCVIQCDIQFDLSLALRINSEYYGRLYEQENTIFLPASVFFVMALLNKSHPVEIFCFYYYRYESCLYHCWSFKTTNRESHNRFLSS